MIQAQTTRPNGKRRKVSIEVYFVLYLSAIVLLLGTAPARKQDADAQLEEAVARLVGSDFRLDAERAALIYSFVPAGLQLDSSSTATIRRDSLNVIRAYGDVTDIHFRIAAISDTTTGKILPVDQASLVREGDRAVVFRWTPSAAMKRNAVYRVTVFGTAQPVLPPSLDKPEIRNRVMQVLQKKGALNDSVTFTVNIFEARTPAQIRQIAGISPTGRDTASAAVPALPATISPVSILNSAAQSFDARATQTSLRTVPRGEWRNTVMIFGTPNAQRDLALQCSGGGRISAITSNSVEISGTAPVNGRQQVTLTATRKSDGRKVTVSFEVDAAPLDSPRIPDALYSGQTVELNFVSSDVAPAQISVEVTENDRVVTSRENGTAVFRYTPQSAAGTVRFQRYIGGQIADRFSIPIRQLPYPRVDQPRQSDDDAIVPTVSYGSFAGKPNKTVLKIARGNAEDPEELTDRYRYDPVTVTHTQYWRVRRRDAGRDFEFTAYALDLRGSVFKSNIVRFLSLKN